MAAAISRGAICAAAQCEDEADAYELSLHHTGLRSMLGLSRCVKLRVLDLSFNALRAIEGLDALGDLALAGAPLLGHYEGKRAGHSLTNTLLRALFATPDAVRLVACDAAQTARLPGSGLIWDEIPQVA